jgi:DNA polymerase-3 subunit gamma/tau
VNKVLGLIPNEIYFNIIEAIRSKDGKSLIDILAEVKSTGMPIQQFVAGLNRHIRNMMIGSVENGLDVLEMNADLKIKYVESAKLWNIRDLLRVSSVITEVEPKVKRAVQPHILIELSLLKLLEMDSVVTIQSLLDNLKNTRIPNFPNSNKSTIAEPIQARQNLVIENTELKEPAAENNTLSKIELTDKISEPKYSPKSNKNITFQEIEENWEKFVDDLSSGRPSIGNALAHCELGQLSGNRLEIKMINGNNFNLRTLEKNKIFIENFLEKTFETQIKTAFLMTKSELPKTDNIEKEKIVKTNKTTAKIIEVFDGELIN